jgi:hypothetical protein
MHAPSAPSLRWLSCAAFLAVALYAPAVAAFTTSTTASATCIDTSAIEDQDGGPGFTSAHCDHSVTINNFIVQQNGLTTGDASAIIGFRSVGVHATASADLQTNIPEDFGAQVNASAQIDDVFLMDASFPNGTPVPSGFMQINAVTTGLVSLDIVGSGLLSTASLDYTLVVGGVSVAIDSVQLGLGGGTSPQPVTAVLSGVVPWTAGVAIPIHMAANASVEANLTFNGSVDAEANFGNSLDWVGISDVTDENHVPVASFTALSPAGLDWGAAVVPEPSAIFLVGTSLVGMIGLGRRRLGSRERDTRWS